MLQILKIQPILQNSNHAFTSFFCNDRDFYLKGCDNKKIFRLNFDFKIDGYYETYREYTSICFDKKEKVYFAVCKSESNCIYKLDSCFKEIDCLDYVLDYDSGCVKSIAYNAHFDTLVLTFKCLVIEVQKNSNLPIKLCQKNKSCTYVDSIFYKNNYIYLNTSEYTDKISVYSKNDVLLLESSLPCDYKAVSLCACEFSKNKDTAFLYILAIKHDCYFYILKCSIVIDDNERECECSCEDEMRKYDCEETCDDECDYDCTHCNGDCDNSFPDTCFDYCEDNCTSCDDDCDKKKKGCHSLKQSCNDIIESVALIETSISHILNAEGEKIQKIIACTDCVCDILAVNDAVANSITKVTHLEHVLHSKLELINKILIRCDTDCLEK